jgi:hypothetical protein
MIGTTYSVICPDIYETFKDGNDFEHIIDNYIIETHSDDTQKKEMLQFKDLLFKLSSLNYRQKFPANQKENKDKKDKELLEIDNIKTIVKNNILFKSRLSKNVKERDIFKKTNSNVSNNGEFNVNNSKIGYSHLIEQSGINNSKLFEEKYNYLSMLSHPSYIGCLQFGEAFSNNIENDYINNILLISNALMSVFINDYKKYHLISDKNIDEVSDNLKLFCCI